MLSAKKIKNILVKKQKKLCCAESCTGGLISSYLTDISGASDFIEQNFITYSPNAKETLLGVKKVTIEKNGVVSSDVAKQMALGLIRKYNCDYALSTTGILGPTGAQKSKPVGTVYIGIANKSTADVVLYNSDKKTRIAIKKDIAKKALEILIKFIEKNEKI